LTDSPCNAAVILDVDGTLVDSNDAHARSWVGAFAEQGVTVAYDDVRRSIGMGGDKLMPAVSGIEEESPEGGRIAKRRAEIFKNTWLPRLRGFPCTRELLERFLADGFTLAVASSAKEDELHPLLEAAGVSDLITTRTSSDDASNSKPDPDIVAAALKRTRCGAGRAIMVGDTPYDVEAARRAGLQVVAFECGGWTQTGLRGADEVYADAADLLRRYDSSIFARLRGRRS
jgi:phosphoglycolate phosphatase-like HAD superfamily hydrolase